MLSNLFCCLFPTKQPGESTNLKLLLQYVIFPLSEPLTSELWVEPQYGTVCEIPPDLDYLLQCSHDQIRNKVGCFDDVMVM